MPMQRLKSTGRVGSCNLETRASRPATASGRARLPEIGESLLFLSSNAQGLHHIRVIRIEPKRCLQFLFASSRFPLLHNARPRFCAKPRPLRQSFQDSRAFFSSLIASGQSRLLAATYASLPRDFT